MQDLGRAGAGMEIDRQSSLEGKMQDCQNWQDLRERCRIIRCVTMPVAGLIGDQTWKDLWAALHESWKNTTLCANWIMTELAKAEKPRKLEDKKPEKFPSSYFYPKLTKLFPNLETNSLCSIDRSVRAKYRSCRFDLWRNSISLPSFRYPMPLPIHNRSWKPSFVDGYPVVRLPIGRECKGKPNWFTIRLKGGPEFRRQLALFKMIVNGEVKKCEAKIYKRGEHLMIGLVAWFPKQPPKERTHTMLVRTDLNALWVAEVEGTHDRVYNQDDLKRMIENHYVFLQRISEDSKFEKRWPKKKIRNINEYRERVCQKFNNRLDTACQQLTASLSQLADRLGCGEVIYDDSEKNYMKKFPWFKLKTLLNQKLDALNIVFTASRESEASEGVLCGQSN